MQKKLYAFFLLLSVLAVSIFIIVLPNFFTNNTSRIQLHQNLELPLLLNDNKDIKLVFFGYTGCVSICTPRLEELSVFYESLDAKTKKRVGIEFFDVSVPTESSLVHAFATAFHKDFKGIYLDDSQIRTYTKAFKVYFSPSLLDEDEFNHSTHLYLVKRSKNTKELRFIYPSYPFNFKQIQLDIEELANE